jgi:hypothetical protein
MQSTSITSLNPQSRHFNLLLSCFSFILVLWLLLVLSLAYPILLGTKGFIVAAAAAAAVVVVRHFKHFKVCKESVVQFPLYIVLSSYAYKIYIIFPGKTFL